VVAGRPDGRESAISVSVEDVLRNPEQGTNSVESDVETSGCDVCVCIETVISGLDRSNDMFYVIFSVGEMKDVKIRTFERNPIEVPADGRTLEELEDGGDPLRPLDVTRGSMICVIVVRTECYSHGGPSSFLSYRSVNKCSVVTCRLQRNVSNAA
jgi:hypothetical protein